MDNHQKTQMYHHFIEAAKFANGQRRSVCDPRFNPKKVWLLCTNTEDKGGKTSGCQLFPCWSTEKNGEAEGLILQTHAAFRDPGAGWNDMWRLSQMIDDLISLVFNSNQIRDSVHQHIRNNIQA